MGTTVDLAGEAALMFAEKFGRDVIIAEVLRTSAMRARIHLEKMGRGQRAGVLPTVRVADDLPVKGNQ